MPVQESTQTAPPEQTVVGTRRFVCVHGHFYQPPRENPWLETVEVQDSAAPFHDWNERITAECYAPNGASRMTNTMGQITRILNNYARMSFNFGPTLLSWLEAYAPRTYRMIQDADRISARHFSGHGSALAQVYNHIIMPLASERDARTQIRWGIADFEHRFGRKPEGMWLAETAVSRKVLDLMAQEGIRFTVLAPNQCARVRRLSTAGAANRADSSTNRRDAAHDPHASSRSDVADAEIPWTETPDARVNPTRPYLVRLDEGRSIAVFFYDGPTSRAIACEGLLNSGEEFGRRILAGLQPHVHDEEPGEPVLAHVATDGESYGHHHRHGEMALSYALHWIEANELADLTNYGDFLEKFPPRWEAEVVENSSWSCFHGVERWRSDCGCNGGKPGWNQRWRGPLREALDLLRDKTAPLAEELAAPLLHDLWSARDAYIQVMLDHRTSNVNRFLAEHATHKLTPAERVTVLELLELERHTQLMYTSCGWFFDDISGIETVQVIAYAARVLQLAAKLFGEAGTQLEDRFLQILQHAESNVPESGNGAAVYRKWIRNARIGLDHVGAHYAISSMFRSYPDAGQIFCFDVQRHSYDVLTSGRGRFGLGRARLTSRVTEESEEICFAVLHLGDQNLSAAVRRFRPEDTAAWSDFNEKARVVIRRANLPELIRLIDGFFGSTVYSLTSLFADEQHRILKSILNQTLSEVEESLMRIYEEHATLLHFLGESNVPAPPALALTARFAINASLRHALEADNYDAAEITRLLRRAEMDNVALDTATLSYAADARMKRAMVALEVGARAQKMNVMAETLAIAESLRSLPAPSNLWQAQNIWNDLLRRPESRLWSREWREAYRKLGTALKISVDDLAIDDGAHLLG
jgi:alpha-amylase/alpha-mannosidase (GH57 family)